MRRSPPGYLVTRSSRVSQPINGSKVLPTKKHRTVPLGHLPQHVQCIPLEPAPLHNRTPNMPFGIAFIGTSYSEYKLIGVAYAFEQATKARLQTRAYPSATPVTQLKDVILR